MSTGRPAVSVIVCTYNRAQCLPLCLDSLFSQDFRDFEVVVVNGPSTDETDLVLAKYPEITRVRQPQLDGLSAARNLGIAAARAGSTPSPISMNRLA